MFKEFVIGSVGFRVQVLISPYLGFPFEHLTFQLKLVPFLINFSAEMTPRSNPPPFPDRRLPGSVSLLLYLLNGLKIFTGLLIISR